MGSIPDFDETEMATIRNRVDERFGEGAVELHHADVELRLDPGSSDLTECPAIYWEAGECHFLVIKTGEGYRNQFFYSAREQYGTGIEEYSDLDDCVATLLRIQADQESVRRGSFPASEAAE